MTKRRQQKADQPTDEDYSDIVRQVESTLRNTTDMTDETTSTEANEDIETPTDSDEYELFMGAFNAAMVAVPRFADMQGFELAMHIADGSQALEQTLAALNELVVLLRTTYPQDQEQIKALWFDLFSLSNSLPMLWLIVATGKEELYKHKTASGYKPR